MESNAFEMPSFKGEMSVVVLVVGSKEGLGVHFPRNEFRAARIG